MKNECEHIWFEYGVHKHLNHHNIESGCRTCTKCNKFEFFTRERKSAEVITLKEGLKMKRIKELCEKYRNLFKQKVFVIDVDEVKTEFEGLSIEEICPELADYLQKSFDDDQS